MTGVIRRISELFVAVVLVNSQYHPPNAKAEPMTQVKYGYDCSWAEFKCNPSFGHNSNKEQSNGPYH